MKLPCSRRGEWNCVGVLLVLLVLLLWLLLLCVAVVVVCVFVWVFVLAVNLFIVCCLLLLVWCRERDQGDRQGNVEWNLQQIMIQRALEQVCVFMCMFLFF